MKFKKWLSPAITALLVLLVLVRIVPQTISNFSHRGLDVPSVEVINLASDSLEQLFVQERNVVIFWASWCAPCKLEMSRVKRLVENADIRADQVLALNPFESSVQVRKFLSEENYPFRFLDDNGYLASLVDVKATPTFLWIEDQKVIKMSTGIHLTGLFSLEEFLSY